MKESALTVYAVTKQVEKIVALTEIDDEGAHVEEDALYGRVLTAIAGGVPNAQQLAQAALECSKLNFSHWYA